MRESIGVSVIQFEPVPLDRDRNLAEMARIVRGEAREHQADLVVFPELSTTGYVPPGDDREFATELAQRADTVPGPTLDALGEAAAATGTHVVAGFCERGDDGALHNSAMLVGPDGGVIGVQRKVHLWADERYYFTPGDAFPVFTTDIARIGLSICYDSRFPECSRAQALAGGELLICLFALVEEAGRLRRQTLTWRSATRALENTTYYIACNRRGVEPAGTFFGGSVVAGPSGDILAEAVGDDPVIRTRLSGSNLSDYRRYMDVFTDRRPAAYGLPQERSTSP